LFAIFGRRSPWHQETRAKLEILRGEEELVSVGLVMMPR